MAHGTNARQVHCADEERSKWIAAHGVEHVPKVEVRLQQLSAPQHPHVRELRIASVYAVCANRDDDVAVARQELLLILVAKVIGDGQSWRIARPHVSKWHGV